MESTEKEGLNLNADPVLTRMINRIGFAGKDVLEPGCGDGQFTLTYLTEANYILCSDPDSEKIEYLKAEWAKSYETSVLDARPERIQDVPLLANLFDVAVFSRSL